MSVDMSPPQPVMPPAPVPPSERVPTPWSAPTPHPMPLSAQAFQPVPFFQQVPPPQAGPRRRPSRRMALLALGLLTIMVVVGVMLFVGGGISQAISSTGSCGGG